MPRGKKFTAEQIIGKLGQNLVFPRNTPLCNAWLTILKGSGVAVEQHGDSTGVLDDLVA
jgi:hypothetical protein